MATLCFFELFVDKQLGGLEAGVLPSNTCASTSSGGVTQLAGVRFILGVGKNPVYFSDRGPDPAAHSYSLMFCYTESQCLFPGCAHSSSG